MLTDDVVLKGAFINGWTISDCTFTNGACVNASHNDYNKNPAAADVTVTGCTFTGSDSDDSTQETRITLFKVDGATISGNTITGSEFNAVQLGGTVNGTIDISGNTISGIADRIFRAGTIAEEMIISDNTVTGNGRNGELIKVDTINGTVTLTDNTWNGYDDEELGYNNGVWSLPIVVTPETTDIAAVIKSAPAGSTIVFAEGNYGKIVLDKIDGLWHNRNYDPDTSAYSNSLQYAGPAGNEYAPEGYPDIYNEDYADFHPTLADNLTLVAEEGATVTIAGLDIYSGTGLYGNNYGGIDVTQATKDVLCVAKNLTISGITFTDDVALKGAFIDGWTISGCTFSNGACVNTNYNSNNKKSASADMTITGCTFTGSDSDAATEESRIILLAVDGATISGNTIDSAEFNAIHLGEAVKGTIEISGNTISNTGDRVFRFGTVTGVVTIENNTVTGNGDNGQMIKATTIEDGATITLSGNKWNSDTVNDNALVESENGGKIWSMPNA